WQGDTDEGRRKIGQFAVLGVGVSALLVVILSRLGWDNTFGGLFVTDSFSVTMKILMAVATALPLLMSMDYLKRNNLEKGEYYVLTLFAMLGGFIMASAGDFMVLYLGLEMMSLSIYVLAAFNRDDIRSSEAGLKYFVLGSLASGILLYGITLIYGTTGTTNISGIHTVLAGMHHVSPMVTVGVVMIIVGLSFKVAAAPFHMWAPDVYQGAPTSVTSFMAVMPKLAAFAVLYRVLFDSFQTLHHVWGPMLQLLAVLSLAVGAFAAIQQTDIKRMLAYSSIGHVGYAMIGLAAGTAQGIQGVMVYLTIYIFMNLGAFAMILSLNADGIGENIDDYKGLSKERPLAAFVMALLMFSMAGIPPLAGFVGKLNIFFAAVDAGLITVAIMGVLFSAVGAFYYLRIVKLMYFDAPERTFKAPIEGYGRAVLVISTALVLIWGLFPGTLLGWAEATVLPFL
ncbi:MAG: NADH-quinone oxidoreductase subunit NuoN, partial [Magnetococcales bacterium]|nr:NADH-quinone oxidoreductase subunit NuoN [Magnetococcales bacterium]